MSRQRTLNVLTPEGISFPLLIASPISRFLALAIDRLCIHLLSGLITIIASAVGTVSKDLAGAVWALLSFALGLAYPIVLEWFMRGQTIGKRMLRLRVMDVQALRLTFSQVVVRNLLRFVDSLPLFYLLGGITSLLSTRGQRIGDIAANTIVVYQPRQPEPDFSGVLPDKYNSFREYPALAARLRQNISPREAGIYLRALLRRDELDDIHRLALFGEIRQAIESGVQFPPEALVGISDEQCVRNVVDILFR